MMAAHQLLDIGTPVKVRLTVGNMDAVITGYDYDGIHEVKYVVRIGTEKMHYTITCPGWWLIVKEGEED